MKDIINCDIIIPVYNAPEELRNCLDSLIQHTDLSNNRIIIINDCSPDPGVSAFLDEIDNPSIVILQNENNLGFVGTVNRGMSYSQYDVVLLNSDTIVTEKWLEKMKKVAYLDHSIATVTPLTNNGSICSVPTFLEDNHIPAGYDIDSFAHYIENISLKKFREIPTAVGFCMYIKRNIINEIGLFDQENFGKGYGEENDFCCRVIEHGYKNILDDHTFIYHKGSMSFQGEKLELLKKNLKTLNTLYPYYDKRIHDFIVKNPLKEIQDNIRFRLSSYVDSYKSKGNLLFVLHNFFDESYTQPIGGTEYHVKDIVDGIKDYFIYVLVTNGQEVVLKQYFQGEVLAKYHFPLEEPIGLQHFHHQEYSEIVEKIINTFEINLVHIHHLIRHSFDIPYVAKKNRIKTIFTLHDFYLFCPRVNLLDVNNVYCKDMRSEQKCNACLRETYGFHSTFINKWKAEATAMMSNVDLFITPSNSTKAMFEEEFGEVNGKIIAIEHGIALPDYDTILRTKENRNWNIAFIGGLSPNKGSDLIYSLITKFPKSNVNWHLIGGLGDQKLNLLNQSNVQKYGRYKREDLKELIEKIEIDLVCLLSPWPETYSYTLTEAWAHNIPVLVTPFGALKERVELIGGGWVTETNDVNDVMDKLKYIIEGEMKEYHKKVENIKGNKVKTKEKMVLDYIEIYNKFLVSKPLLSMNALNNRTVLEGLKYYHPVNDSSVSLNEYNSHVQKLENELEAVKSTIGWKVLNVLRSRDHFILKLGKKGIHLILRVKNRLR